MNISYIQQQLEAKEKEYERLKQWSIQQLSHLKSELNNAVARQETDGDTSYIALQNVIKEQDSLIQLLNDNNETQKQQIQMLNSQIQQDNKKYSSLQDEIKEYAKNSQLIKEEMNLSHVNKQLNISDINSEKIKEITSHGDSPEQLCPSKLINQQNLLKLSEVKVQMLSKQNESLKAQINKYKELLSNNNNLNNQVTYLTNEMNRSNIQLQQQNEIIDEQHKQIQQLSNNVKEQKHENTMLLQQLEQMQLSTKDIEALNTEIIQLEYKANNIKNSIEQSQLLNSSNAFHKSISNSQSLTNSLMIQSLTMQQLSDQLLAQKKINKQLNKQLYDIQIKQINQEAQQFQQLRKRIADLEILLKQKEQESHMKQKMIIELNNMIQILQHENAALKGKV